jgi:hypothetical protein
MQDFLAKLRPALEAEGDWQEVAAAVKNVIRGGNGAHRQRQWLAQTGDLSCVMDHLIEATSAVPEFIT